MTIETNTEELREILQTVYDLPNAGGGGSNEPDLVIGFKPYDGDMYFSDGDPNKFSFDADAVRTVRDKVLLGKAVNCVLNMECALFEDGTYAFASSPHVFARVYMPGNNSGTPTHLDLYFRVMWDEMHEYMAYMTFEVTETSVTIVRTALQSGYFLTSTFR